jgi:lipopolysaccharide/colanic/teichoic acid biosynthesis glycosyltransferase
MKRLFDAATALVALVALSPLLVVAAIGIRLTSPGPILYAAERVARDRRRNGFDRGSTAGNSDRRRRDGYTGRKFTMYKFRTMRVMAGHTTAPITARNDTRVFPFGSFLRATKIDELPQLFNVLKGDMALVGPRPEAPEIVRTHYTQIDLKTLQVRPGVTSPGTVYYYTHCESTLAADGVLDQYVAQLLPAKLALDRVYLERATLFYDLRIILRTVAGIIARVLGTTKWFPDPPELRQVHVNRPAVPAREDFTYSDPTHRLQ